MKRLRQALIASILLLCAASIPAAAQIRTHVNLAGKDDSLPKLGLPGIRVRVDSADIAQAEMLRQGLGRDIFELTHARPLAGEETGDYQLLVHLYAPVRSGTGTVQPFEAELMEPEGTRLWRVDGRTEVEGIPLDDRALTHLGRNIISALVHDGWLQAKDDPNNPPPPPPMVRRESP